MSLSNDPADKSKPVLKDKNPHNYRKVGYSMIIISVSLVIIGLLSWNLSDNYHFSSNIMALQEVDAMTPKTGYNIVLFDVSQPVGAKLKLLDHADTIDAAQQLQSQDAAQNPGSTIQVLLFNGTENYNLNLMSDAEVFLQTPKTGYNVVLDNYNLAVGQKLTLGSHEDSLDNATSYEKQQQDQIQGQEVKVLVFTPDFTDNLKMVTNSNVPVGSYAMLPNNPVNRSLNMSQTSVNQVTPVTNSSSSSVTVAQSSPIQSNLTTNVMVHGAAITTTNQTVLISNNPSVASVPANKTMVTLSNPAVSAVTTNKTTGMSSNLSTTKTTMNVTSSNVVMNASATAGISKSINLNETANLNATGK